MTNDQIKAKLANLNQAQRCALRKKFNGQVITAIWFNATIDLLQVQFGKVQHDMFIGPRGGIRHHTINRVMEG